MMAAERTLPRYFPMFIVVAETSSQLYKPFENAITEW
jgi:hypothetical protein